MKNAKTKTCWLLFLALFLFLAGLYLMLIARGIFQAEFWFTAVISCIGLVLLVFVYIKNMKSKYMFLAVLLLLSGILGTVSASFGLPIKKFWPIFMIIFGISIFIAGWYKTHKAMSNFLIISILFISLGGFFCIFSFGYSSMRLRTFLFYWWPAIFFVGGIVLLALYLVGRSQEGAKKQ